MNPRQLLRRLSQRHFDNVAFEDSLRLAEALGYRLDRISGSHHVYIHPAVPEPLSLQPRRGEAKAYQLRELLDFVQRYDLRLEGNE